jgi:hypothetical protein
LSFSLVVAFALFLVACSGGCESKLQTAYTVRTTFNAALEEGLKLHKAGKISDDALLASEPFVKAVPPLLDELDRAAVEGNAFRWQVVYGQASDSLDRLLRWLASVRVKK